MASQFSTTCGVVATNNYDTCGTLTKANLSTLTTDQIKALFQNADTLVWNENASYLKTQFEMRACGIRRYGFYDWLMSSNRPGLSTLITPVRRDKGSLLVPPFIMGRQRSVINSDFWYITNGWDVDAYVAETTGPLTAEQLALKEHSHGAVLPEVEDRVIRVKSVYGGSSFELSAAWFLARHSIYVLNTKAGASAHGEWKVLAATAATDKTYVDVLITSQNTYSNTLADTTPSTGLVLIGVNNVNDYESWCHNPANYNPWKHVPFWYQTFRRTRCVDTAYKEMFAKLMADNEWFAKFGDIPLAERNKQDEIEHRKQVVHTLLFGRPISSNQTLDLWGSLSNITAPSGAVLSPGTSGELVAKRANLIGFYEILKSCVDSDGYSRVRDLQNQALNIAEFFEELKLLYRARKSNGKANPEQIDCYTGSVIADLLEVGIINWFKDKYGTAINFDIEVGQNEWGFTWRTFKLPFYGIKLNVIQDEFFDDLETAFTTASVTRGGFLLLLDIGKGASMYPAVLASNRKVYTVGDINKLAQLDSTYSCVMEAPTSEKTLSSTTITAIVECPSNSLWIEGINTTNAFIYTGKVTPYGNLYGGSNS